MRDHRELEVWVRARDLAVEVCSLSRIFPVDERFALTAHIRRRMLHALQAGGYSSSASDV